MIFVFEATWTWALLPSFPLVAFISTSKAVAQINKQRPRLLNQIWRRKENFESLIRIQWLLDMFWQMIEPFERGQCGNKLMYTAYFVDRNTGRDLLDRQ